MSAQKPIGYVMANYQYFYDKHGQTTMIPAPEENRIPVYAELTDPGTTGFVAWIDGPTTGCHGNHSVDYYNEVVDKLPIGTKLFTLPLNAQQALSMAADKLREYKRNRPTTERGHIIIDECIATIEQLTPPTDPYQQARAEGVFGMDEITHAMFKAAEDAGVSFSTQQKCWRAWKSAITPSQDTVRMTREVLEEFGKNCAREALFQASNGVINDADYNLSAIVAQHMPEGAKS